ncbi:histone H1-like repetitive region-containing protein [Nannocystis bainbridge]|uniref:Histone H1-like repetitive region-containing protein n=1 Tax=Nannocystis bainbridge TaxID=2995303 RepID=A0ABT5E5M2_9BACT|nr:histone H1-like repetitive region-containing protein [Nannocystis bainbridge]MDC0721147.1 histone H1-like repetitive region-containing protein [Nannocystis bainbridge]
MRAGPVVLYFRGASIAREAEARGFVTALGGDGARAARFVDDGEHDNSGRDAIVAAMRAGAVGVIVSPSYQDLVYGFFVDETIRPLVEEHDVAIADLFDPELLSPDFDRVHDLWDGDEDAWEPLLEGLAKRVLGDAAPASFCEELVALSDDLAAWSQRAGDVAGRMRSEYVYSGLRSGEHLTTWVRNGVLDSLPADDPTVLAVRLDALERRPDREVVEHGRALLIDLRAHDDLALLHRALLVHAARCLEEGLWAEAEATAEEARPFERDPELPRRAERLSLAARFGRGEITSALAGLDALFLAEREAESTAGAVLHAKRSFMDLDEHEAVLRELALSIQVAREPSKLVEPLTRLCGLIQDKADADRLRNWLAAQKPAAVKPPVDFWGEYGRITREKAAAQAPAAKKAAPKKATSKKAVSKKAAAKKAATTKAAPKKATSKKAVSKKAAAKKAATTKAASKEATSKKAATKKAASKTAASKQAAPKKAAFKKAASKKATSKKATSKKAASKKAASKKTPAKT